MTKPEKKTVRFQLVWGQSEMEAVEAYRATQKPIPNKSEAIRQLVRLALAERGINLDTQH